MSWFTWLFRTLWRLVRALFLLPTTPEVWAENRVWFSNFHCPIARPRGLQDQYRVPAISNSNPAAAVGAMKKN